MAVQCNLAELRRKRGVSAAVLARTVGVQRQTIYAIESGNYVPNTVVALKLARELGVPVEDLFCLPGIESPAPDTVRARIVNGPVSLPNAAVRLVRVTDEWLAFPCDPRASFLPQADGLLLSSHGNSALADVAVLDHNEHASPCLVVAGCDPALSLLAKATENVVGTSVLPVSACSKEALRWLRKRWVHVAGCHLKDAASTEFNVSALRRLLPSEDLCVFTFAEWEEGFVVPEGNPLNIREAGDLANPKLRYINREPGSGSRALLDRLLRKAAVPFGAVSGYNHVTSGHLAAARAIYEGQADCCIATSSASKAFQLDFIPLQQERFDLVILRENLDLPAVKALLDSLQRQSLRRRLQTLAGYDVTRTGNTVLQ